MHRASGLIAVGVLAGLLVACGGDGSADGQRVAALSNRVDALEKRLAAAEQAGEPIERLRNDAASLDRRVSSLETSVRELAARPAVTAPAVPTSPTSPPAPGTVPARPMPRGPTGQDAPRVDRATRRTELRALSEEFRGRLSELRSQPGGIEGSEKTREILEWYRDQRRAILRGEGRTDQ